jgi:hypothetical protein
MKHKHPDVLDMFTLSDIIEQDFQGLCFIANWLIIRLIPFVVCNLMTRKRVASCSIAV